MIEGYIKNNTIHYKTTLKVIDNKDIFLAVDGNTSLDYYKEIISMYKKNKYNFINRIKDFISVYLYDKKTNELLLITDRIGAKKIYYTKDKDILYFSNDLRNIKCKNKIINTDVLSIYFRYHYIVEPYTIFENIYKIKHGNYLVYKNDISINNYWSVVDVFNNRVINNDYNKCKNELKKRLINKTKELITNKNNIGVYVSGGIDSNTIASVYNSINKKKINSFTVAFDNEEYDESSISNKVSKILNSNHKVLLLDKEHALENVKKIANYYCEPFGDPSAICSIALNEFAKKNSIKNALTGDGSDQLFCGATIYDTMYKIQKYSKLNIFNIHLPNSMLKNKYLYYLFSNVPNKYKTQIDSIYREKVIDGLFEDKGNKRLEEDKIYTKNLQEERMILDIDTFMAQRVFPKMCIAANVNNNIEIISPFLTKDIIEYSFSIPHKYKYYKKTKKYILKELLFEYLPRELFSNKKRGFAIPTKEWLSSELNDDLKRLSTKEFIKKQNIFNYDKVEYIINHISEDTNLVWDYYMFQLWYEKNIINKKDLS